MNMQTAMRAILAAPQSTDAIRAGLAALNEACGYSTVAHLYTRGEYLDINAAGWITRKGAQFSGQWRIVRAVERTNFGTVARFYTLAELLDNPRDIPWTFKNGKPRVFIRYYDHGTILEWSAAAHIIAARTDAAHVATLAAHDSQAVQP